VKRFIAWSAVTILLAALFHIAGVWYLPRFITRVIVNRARQAADITGANQIFYSHVHSAGEDAIVLDNPDSMFSFAAYDVSEKPVRMKCVVPETNNYWSVSFYASNTDNFYVVNDMTAKAKQFDLVLVKPDSKYRKIGDEEVITAPSNKGVILVRMIVNDRNNPEEMQRLSELQKQTVIQELDNTTY
jgi:uncharacterized membrane protein